MRLGRFFPGENQGRLEIRSVPRFAINCLESPFDTNNMCFYTQWSMFSWVYIIKITQSTWFAYKHSVYSFVAKNVGVWTAWSNYLAMYNVLHDLIALYAGTHFEPFSVEVHKVSPLCKSDYELCMYFWFVMHYLKCQICAICWINTANIHRLLSKPK